MRKMQSISLITSFTNLVECHPLLESFCRIQSVIKYPFANLTYYERFSVLLFLLRKKTLLDRY